MLCASCAGKLNGSLPLLLLRRRLQQSVISTACSSRGFASDGIDRRDEKPEAYHLEHIQQRLAYTVPQMFRERMDYTFYRKDVVLDDQIFRLKKSGRDAVMSHMGLIAVAGCFFVPHIEAEVIGAHPVLDDGTVRLRWRVKYVSFLRLFKNPRLFRSEYRYQNLSWYDGYSVFTVDGNGDVYHVTLQKTQRDEGLLNNSTKKLAEKIGILPEANTRFQGMLEKKTKNYESDGNGWKDLVAALQRVERNGVIYRIETENNARSRVEAKAISEVNRKSTFTAENLLKKHDSGSDSSRCSVPSSSSKHGSRS